MSPLSTLRRNSRLRLLPLVMLAGCAAWVQGQQARIFDLNAEDCTATDSMGRVTLSADGGTLGFAASRCTATPAIGTAQGGQQIRLNCSRNDDERWQRDVTIVLGAALVIRDARGTTTYAACPVQDAPAPDQIEVYIPS